MSGQIEEGPIDEGRVGGDPLHERPSDAGPTDGGATEHGVTDHAPVDHDAATIDVAVPAGQVFALLADVTRTGEWSPVCRSAEWLPPSTEAAVGARFVGHNVKLPFRWSRECEITAYEPPHRLAFRTFFRGREATRWEYRLDDHHGGTRVTERYEAVFLPRWIALLRKLPGAETKTRRDAAANIRSSLANLKAVAERAAA